MAEQRKVKCMKIKCEKVENAKINLRQRCATLFGSQATLVTKFVYAGHYMYLKDLFNLAFER